MTLDELDYHLPEDRIARFPLAERDASRLLVLERKAGNLSHHRFRDLPELLEPGDLVVRNVSRVNPARLQARRATGGQVELLLMAEHSPGIWRALARPAGRLRLSERLILASGKRAIVRQVPGTEQQGPGILIEAPELEAEMRTFGSVPLPPYLKREPVPEDRERYQTVWASVAGSTAAPTAGLHFTQQVLAEMVARGLQLADLWLHVGPGTFLPVRTPRIEDHPIHEEAFEVPASTALAARQALSRGRRILAVGTTTVRALESAAASGAIEPTTGHTRLLIVPGFHFRASSALLTNFHQPRSTLLALVAAFTGIEFLREAYREALRADYRFLSYGDAMLVL